MSILRLTFRHPTVTIRVLHTMKVAAQAMCHINRPRTSLAFVHSLPSTSMPAARVPIISKTAVTCLLQPCLVDRSHISTAVVQLPMRWDLWMGPLHTFQGSLARLTMDITSQIRHCNTCLQTGVIAGRTRVPSLLAWTQYIIS